MNLSVETNLSVLTVLLQGLLSFFSPCVLPLLPVYFGYLSGGTAQKDQNGVMQYDRRRVFGNTLFFVLGISFAFSALGLGMTALGVFFRGHQHLFSRIGGVIILLFGLIQLTLYSADTARLLRIPGLSRLFGFFAGEHRLPLRLSQMALSPLTAFLLGFVFSFAWTPCVGPTLSSVLLMAAARGSAAEGFLLIAVYTLGFVVPFLAAGLFTTSLLGLFRRHSGIVRGAALIGAAIMIVIGALMLTGGASRISSWAAGTGQSPAAGSASPDSAGSESVSDPAAPAESGSVSDPAVPAESESVSEPADPESTAESPDAAEAAGESSDGANDPAPASQAVPAPDFTLTDQFGQTHTLSDYRGKTVFLNFWATWCPPCRAEMPDIQKLYEEYSSGVNTDEDPGNDVVILGVAAPGYGQETDAAGIADFLDKNGYSYPVVMDEGGTLYSAYYITSFPTTFMIDRDGNVFGYVTGSLPEQTMRDIIAQTQENGG